MVLSAVHHATMSDGGGVHGGVCVGVEVRVAVTEPEGVRVALAVGVVVDVAVRVGVLRGGGVTVEEAVGVRVALADGVTVAVGVGVTIVCSEGVTVAVTVGVANGEVVLHFPVVDPASDCSSGSNSATLKTSSSFSVISPWNSIGNGTNRVPPIQKGVPVLFVPDAGVNVPTGFPVEGSRWLPFR